ncbi:general vesicular transport factor p115-like [Sinocyclocheilus anshuiensis]|uniref:general vesicular transport factor p115-like n=1 Tax=Sinocyclocheilus anshuiensis TaxID=1608454 RepID=UPI0007B92C60|nr:PREDICTED: general vesicular transport factor p115-like [Sinocyclocheilus anshuiensis]
MNYIWEAVGRQPPGQQPSGAETIQKLCDRVASSTLLEDRRDAVRAIKSLSKKYRVEVGTMAMDHLLRILQSDRTDTEILGYALDTLYNIVCSDEEEEPEDSEEENQQKQEDDLGARFTEEFIGEPDNITLLLTLLEEFDFHVRWRGVKLLTVLLKSQCAPVQSIVLVSPMGVSRLMDLLADSREVIRNDGLLLLQQLTKGNTAIQKIVAFENAFERLLEIITEEGSSDGGIVVEDCLLLLLNLLKNNSSNQNFFKEGSYIQKMKPWFEVGDDNSGWSAQKVTNLHLMLQLVRVMVSPVNSPGATASCQKAMFQCGLLQQLCTILMATGVPADILTETINTVSEVIRGSEVNQDYFASVNAPSNPPRPAIVVLLMSMVNERQPFVLRCAVLYCFQCFLYKNHKGQGEIVATLLPSTIDASSMSAGQLLCGGLFSADSLSNWCAAVALAHALQDNLTQKEQLLRVQLATSLGKPPVSLLQQSTNILSQGDKLERRGSHVQTKVGLLMLLCTWISNCPIAVMHFLHNQDNVPFVSFYLHTHTYTHTLSHTHTHSLWYIWKCLFGVQQKAEATPSAEGSTSDATELQKEVELLRAQLQSQSAEIAQLQREKHQLLRGSDTTAAAAGDDAVRSELESRLSAQTLKEQVQALLESKELMEKELSSATSSAAIMQTEKSKLQQELQESKKEQDDLLMLLADQDQKILSLKHRLEDLGETIEDEDDLDARDQFDDDDDEEEEECDE